MRVAKHMYEELLYLCKLPRHFERFIQLPFDLTSRGWEMASGRFFT